MSDRDELSEYWGEFSPDDFRSLADAMERYGAADTLGNCGMYGAYGEVLLSMTAARWRPPCKPSWPGCRMLMITLGSPLSRSRWPAVWMIPRRSRITQNSPPSW